MVKPAERSWPYHFPNEAEQMQLAAQEFRKLSARDRFLAILDLIASAEAIMARSPNRETANRLREIEEEKWRQTQKELFARYGE